jgi:hypothetical protein
VTEREIYRALEKKNKRVEREITWSEEYDHLGII